MASHLDTKCHDQYHTCFNFPFKIFFPSFQIKTTKRTVDSNLVESFCFPRVQSTTFSTLRSWAQEVSFQRFLCLSSDEKGVVHDTTRFLFVSQLPKGDSNTVVMTAMDEGDVVKRLISLLVTRRRKKN